MFDALRQTQPGDAAIAFDALAVLGWAERDGEAVALAERTPLDQAPAYVLEAVAKAYRNQQRFAPAVTIYRGALERFPGDLPFALGLIYALADAGELEAAEQEAAALRQTLPRDPAVLMAAAYAAERGGRHLEAIGCYQRILEIDPEHRQARRQYLLALNAIGAAHLAADRAARSPELLNEAEWRRLRGSQAAHAVRWGKLPSADDEPRFAETDRALGLIARNLASLDANDPADRPWVLQARFDRLVALRDRVQMAQAVAEYRSLAEEGATIPAYALQAAADAYLYLEQPGPARDLYRQILEERPDDFYTRLSLFYALVETEDFPGALALVDQLAGEQAAWQFPGGSRGGRANPARLDAEIAAALARVFAGDLAEAQRRFAAMRQLAPQNPDLRQELAGVYAARGWPRRAHEAYRLGLAGEPRHRGLQTGLAGTYLDLNEFALGEEAIADLYRRFPEVKPVQRLNRRWQIHNLRELRVEVGYARASEGTLASREFHLESTLFSSPVRENFRGFVSGYWSRGEFLEGDGIARRYGVGLEYRQRDLEGTAELTLTDADAASGKPGIRIAGTWFADDHWSFPADLELLSRDTPLRALRNNVYADAARLGASYRWSELRRLHTSAQVMDFSDGNLRTALFGSLRQRLVSRPHAWYDAELALYASANSRSDVPYYSPEGDVSAELSFDNTWLLYRRYSRSFSHRLALTPGGYWQKGHGLDPIGTVLYEHLWRAAARFELDYGLALTRRVYDGEAEDGSYYYLRLNWRL